MQGELTVLHGAGQGLQGALALAHDTQAAQQIRVGRRQRRRRGEHAVEPLEWGGDGVPQRLHQTRAQCAGSGHGDLLAQHGAHGQLEAVQRAGHPQAFGAGEAGAQHRVDGLRVGVQVQPAPYPGNQHRQQRCQRLAQAHLQARGLGLEVHMQPARAGTVTLAQPQRTLQAQAIVAGLLHARQRTSAQKTHHRRHVIGRAPAQPNLHHTGGGRRRSPAQRAGAQAIVALEGIVETAQAGETAGQCHLGHGQSGVGQQLFGRKQAAGLQVLQRRHAELRLEDAAQVAVAHAHALGHSGGTRRFTMGPGFGFVHQPRSL